MSLQAALLLLSRKNLSSRTYFRLWICYDLAFSLILFAINEAGGSREVYPAVWRILQPGDAMLLGGAVVEALGLERHWLGMVAITGAVGMLLDPHRILAASMLVCFVGASALALRGRDAILMLYCASQCVQHLAVIAHAKRWHAGAYAEVATCLCMAAWIYRLRSPRRGLPSAVPFI